MCAGLDLCSILNAYGKKKKSKEKVSLKWRLAEVYDKMLLINVKAYQRNADHKKTMMTVSWQAII
jgi:hypothetical protein